MAIALDQETGNYVISEIDDVKAKALDLSDESARIFNAEVPLLNAISSDIAEELTFENDPTLERSAALWESYKSQLAPETIEVLIRSANHYMNTVR